MKLSMVLKFPSVCAAVSVAWTKYLSFRDDAVLVSMNEL
jgi:hypothetical protein